MLRLEFLLSLLFFACSSGSAAERVSFHHENVLGTSLEIKFSARTKAAAKEAETLVLAEIDRLALIYSTYDPKSEMRRWMDGESNETIASKELIELFRMCEEQWTATQGAFDPRVGHAIELWKQAAKDQKVPTESELDSAVALTKNQAWRIDDAKQSIRRLGLILLVRSPQLPNLPAHTKQFGTATTTMASC